MSVVPSVLPDFRDYLRIVGASGTQRDSMIRDGHPRIGSNHGWLLAAAMNWVVRTYGVRDFPRGLAGP